MSMVDRVPAVDLRDYVRGKKRNLNFESGSRYLRV